MTNNTEDQEQLKAAFIGRFQPFHKGHQRVVEKYRESHNLVIALGSPRKSRTERNPLNAEERKEVIKSRYDLEIVEVEDEDRGEEGHEDWIQNLISETDADAVISGNQLVQRIVKEHSDIRMIEVNPVEPTKFSGTEIRRRIRQQKNWENLVPDKSQKIVEKYEHIIKNTEAKKIL